MKSVHQIRELLSKEEDRFAELSFIMDRGEKRLRWLLYQLNALSSRREELLKLLMERELEIMGVKESSPDIKSLSDQQNHVREFMKIGELSIALIHEIEMEEAKNLPIIKDD